MENNSPQKQPQRKMDLFIGLFLVVLGSYRLYNIYFNGTEFPTYKIVLTYGFVGFGFYNLYKYFILSQKN